MKVLPRSRSHSSDRDNFEDTRIAKGLRVDGGGKNHKN